MPAYSALQGLVGKTIASVVVKRHREERPPVIAIFILFDDGTYIEFFGGIGVAKGVDTGGLDTVRAYIADAYDVVFETAPVQAQGVPEGRRG